MPGRPVGNAGDSASAIAGVGAVRGRGGTEAGGVGRASIGDGVGLSISDNARTRAGGAGGPFIAGGLREGGGGTARDGDPAIDKGLTGGGGGAFLAAVTKG